MDDELGVGTEINSTNIVHRSPGEGGFNRFNHFNQINQLNQQL